ncbi:hypothetical protein OX283_003305 [Flavobacterium sp. SUN052]|uniref:hypothetical protein n=1 Tax=Flavobacterium sp. SUN052 TaxID=3002441 RepID=UPI00237DE480|nr:hypothetical protein [Flavobacterium sp. SUN052]MEC4003669.1 hypothetical protein [Flavobacterium sp. SUN052]
MKGYNIVENYKIDTNITFIRIDPTDIKLTLKEVFQSLSDLSWLSKFDGSYILESFNERANSTIKHIADNIIKSNDSSITSSSAEYVVSELARKAIVNELKYLDIPLAELIKKQKIGNPGFDFYSENLSNILLFGEAKFLTSKNAYGKAFEQIIKFEKNKSDIEDLIDFDRFCSKDSLEKFNKKEKGFIAAFSSKSTKTDVLLKNISKNLHFIEMKKFSEIICIAVNL